VYAITFKEPVFFYRSLPVPPSALYSCTTVNMRSETCASHLAKQNFASPKRSSGIRRSSLTKSPRLEAALGKSRFPGSIALAVTWFSGGRRTRCRLGRDLKVLDAGSEAFPFSFEENARDPHPYRSTKQLFKGD